MSASRACNLPRSHPCRSMPTTSLRPDGNAALGKSGEASPAPPPLHAHSPALLLSWGRPGRCCATSFLDHPATGGAPMPQAQAPPWQQPSPSRSAAAITPAPPPVVATPTPTTQELQPAHAALQRCVRSCSEGGCSGRLQRFGRWPSRRRAQHISAAPSSLAPSSSSGATPRPHKPTRRGVPCGSSSATGRRRPRGASHACGGYPPCPRPVRRPARPPTRLGQPTHPTLRPRWPHPHLGRAAATPTMKRAGQTTTPNPTSPASLARPTCACRTLAHTSGPRRTTAPTFGPRWGTRAPGRGRPRLRPLHPQRRPGRPTTTAPPKIVCLHSPAAVAPADTHGGGAATRARTRRQPDSQRASHRMPCRLSSRRMPALGRAPPHRAGSGIQRRATLQPPERQYVTVIDAHALAPVCGPRSGPTPPATPPRSRKGPRLRQRRRPRRS